MTPTLHDKLHTPFEDCLPFDRSKTGVSEAFFVSGDPNPDRLQVQYWVRNTDQHVFGRAYFGKQTQGPPGHAHGGSIAALLDEAMGIASWVAGHPVVAAEITLKFRRSLPLHTVPEFHAWVERVDGRKVFARAVLVNELGDRYADGSGLFMVLSPARMEELKALFLKERA